MGTVAGQGDHLSVQVDGNRHGTELGGRGFFASPVAGFAALPQVHLHPTPDEDCRPFKRQRAASGLSRQPVTQLTQQVAVLWTRAAASCVEPIRDLMRVIDTDLSNRAAAATNGELPRYRPAGIYRPRGPRL